MFAIIVALRGILILDVKHFLSMDADSPPACKLIEPLGVRSKLPDLLKPWEGVYLTSKNAAAEAEAVPVTLSALLLSPVAERSKQVRKWCSLHAQWDFMTEGNNANFIGSCEKRSDYHLPSSSLRLSPLRGLYNSEPLHKNLSSVLKKTQDFSECSRAFS